MKHFALFGQHPRLSLAEFRSIKPDVKVPRLFGQAALFEDPDWDGDELMALLGGTVKLGDIVYEASAEEDLADRIAELLAEHGSGRKLEFGLTVFSGKLTATDKRLPIETKDALKRRDIKARWVSGEGGERIAPAAVSKLDMTSQGTDVCVFKTGDDALIGLTTHVQDADAWSLRDYGRPARDRIVGMLPPKLARIMVNLGRINPGETVLDPFCGGGTVMMEAALATKAPKIIGSDLDAEQVANAETNTAWLIEHGVLDVTDEGRIRIMRCDATTIGKCVKDKIDCVITEGDLGPPLTGDETQETLQRNAEDVAALWRRTLVALHPIMNRGGRIVCVWPSYKSSHGMARVDLTDDPALAGKFEIVDPLDEWDDSHGPLLYHRQGQKIMRRIVVMKVI